MVVNACVQYSEEMYIGVGDINLGGQHFQIFCQFEQTKNGDKPAILNWILTTLHRIHGRMVVNACVQYREEIFIGVGDINPDGQHFQIFCQFEQTKMGISRPF